MLWAFLFGVCLFFPLPVLGRGGAEKLVDGKFLLVYATWVVCIVGVGGVSLFFFFPFETAVNHLFTLISVLCHQNSILISLFIHN